MQSEIITTTEELNIFTENLTSSPISLDTEFVRTRTYFANLGLLQVSQNNKITLIDPISIPDLSSFWKAIDSKDCILHASSEDLEIIREHKGDLNFNLFDTQVACSFLNMGNSVGYAKMVETLEGVIVDKGESRTNWCARPLSDKQISYAAVDVLYLEPCLDKMHDSLKSKGMNDFFNQECQTILEQKMIQKDPAKAYNSLNNLFKLDRKGLAVIKELATWRVKTAETRNLALNFVIKADHIWLLAHYRPTSISDLQKLHMLPNEIRIHGQEVLNIIADIDKLDETQYPELTSRLTNYPLYKKTFKSMKEEIQKCADEFDLSTELIASKRLINEYLSWAWKLSDTQKEKAARPKLISGWRNDLVGHKFSQ